jgi:hypothetical protein
LRDAVVQPELLRTGDDVVPHPPRGIDAHLEAGEQSRAVLDLVEHGAVREPVQEADRVLCGPDFLLRQLKRQVRQVRKGQPGQCRLARVARAGRRDDRESPGQGCRSWSCLSSDHVGASRKICTNRQFDY